MLITMLFRILLISLALTATACTSMVMGGGQSAGVHDQHDGRTLEQVEADAKITQAVQQALRHYKSIDVNTTNGTVTLQGSAPSQYEVHRIITQVYKIDGVQRVESYLRVRAP